ncbi:right-handed parallel beta-helix repeat-containing protein [Prolixibacteraceae bacterium Z1-6]|uniref:Right-handed parallel beta-helix repeat-containing protein n=1 Tax=Draconibacterium aestuarii TaxID=2998507 RepID=A0A9X3FCV4_9BACT|nr:right-handed parallel beta-helix repeat-containing protein [Prolixibacteraceae bacterium Z1-6]
MKYTILLSIVVFFFSCSVKNNFYVDAENGNDSNSGHSPQSAWKTLNKLNQTNFKPGDRILLAAGSTFKGSLELKNISGTKEKPVKISSYNRDEKGQLPIIDSKGFNNGILLENCSHVLLTDIEITGNGGGQRIGNKPGMNCGVLVTATVAADFENIQLKNLQVHDIFFEESGYQRGKDEVRTANGSQSYGWGIRFINQNEKATISGILVENCRVENVAHTGIKFTGGNQNIQDIKLCSNLVLFSGGPGMQMSGVKNVHVQNNHIANSGSSNDSRKWGRGSGLWTWGSSDVLIEKNSFRNANGPGDSAGCHIDFNCTNVVVQYNLSENNAGGFCEILGNNYNCAYRYNVSINDGHRVKGENGTFQEGKIFWLSGYAGNGRKRTGPFNTYFYNNTIYVSKDIVAKIAVDRASAGVLIANNIFCIEGESLAVKGDQYKPETEGESRVKNIVFKNNLYLKEGNWPAGVLIQDNAPMFGNPEFQHKNGKELSDYIPGNRDLIKDRGVEIKPIPGDEIGLVPGLKVSEDILGNPIARLPDLGAIEIN